MWIDVSIVAIIVIFGLLGLASGFWGQFLRIAALGSLYFVAPPVARVIREPLGEQIDVHLSDQALDGVSLIAAAVGLYVVMSLAILIFLAVLFRGRKSASNKLGGLFLGTTKGVVLSYLLLCGFLMISTSDFEDELDNELIEQTQESHLVELVESHNLLDLMGYEIPTQAELEAMVEEHFEVLSDSPKDGVPRSDGNPEGPESAAEHTVPVVVEAPENEATPYPASPK